MQSHKKLKNYQKKRYLMTCRRFIEHRHEAKNSRSIALKAGKLVNKVQKRKHDENIRKKTSIQWKEYGPFIRTICFSLHIF